MSIIYADTCKACCHINNCIAKTVTEKEARMVNVGNSRRGATFTGLNPQNSFYTVLIAHHKTLNLGSMPSMFSLIDLLYADSFIMNSWRGKKKSYNQYLMLLLLVALITYSCSSCAPLFMERLALINVNTTLQFGFRSRPSLLLRVKLISPSLGSHPGQEPSSSQQVWLPPVSSANYSR